MKIRCLKPVTFVLADLLRFFGEATVPLRFTFPSTPSFLPPFYYSLSGFPFPFLSPESQLEVLDPPVDIWAMI